jgi:hypothetical protein
MLFADFIRDYKAVTLRRLPGIEMSELEFYSWWPLRIVLLAFVVNMVTATVRRIEFKFENLGVLTVHTGIVTIALGSVYYTGLKKEGDTIVFAGEPTPGGETTIGPPSGVFYDNTRVALFVDGFKGWEQRPLSNIPRYNDYALTDDHPRTLDLDVMPSRTALVDPDIRFRVVGYAAYADLAAQPVKASDAEACPRHRLRDRPPRALRRSPQLHPRCPRPHAIRPGASLPPGAGLSRRPRLNREPSQRRVHASHARRTLA